MFSCRVVITLDQPVHITQGPIFQLPRWIPQCIRFDSMHVLCLGVDLLVAGNVIKTLLGYDFWGDGEEDQQLLVGWQLFKQWAKRMGWQPPDCLEMMCGSVVL